MTHRYGLEGGKGLGRASYSRHNEVSNPITRRPTPPSAGTTYTQRTTGLATVRWPCLAPSGSVPRARGMSGRHRANPGPARAPAAVQDAVDEADGQVVHDRRRGGVGGRAVRLVRAGRGPVRAGIWLVVSWGLGRVLARTHQ